MKNGLPNECAVLIINRKHLVTETEVDACLERNNENAKNLPQKLEDACGRLTPVANSERSWCAAGVACLGTWWLCWWWCMIGCGVATELECS